MYRYSLTPTLVSLAQVFDDLGMEQYVIHANDRKGKFDMKSKERADVLEALLGALYVDKDLEYCKVRRLYNI